jgi:hypothetical protein
MVRRYLFQSKLAGRWRLLLPACLCSGLEQASTGHTAAESRNVIDAKIIRDNENDIGRSFRSADCGDSGPCSQTTAWLGATSLWPVCDTMKQNDRCLVEPCQRAEDYQKACAADQDSFQHIRSHPDLRNKLFTARTGEDFLEIIFRAVREASAFATNAAGIWPGREMLAAARSGHLFCFGNPTHRQRGRSIRLEKRQVDPSNFRQEGLQALCGLFTV